MNHVLVAPIVLPAIAGAALLLLHAQPIRIARWLSAAATVAFLACALALFQDSLEGVPRVYALGSWPAPFGIVVVVDRLSAWMVLLTALLACGVLLYAMQGWDSRGRFFHAFFQFQLMGLAGAFLTGDLFNLFVFFEVMLIASYCLMLQGLGAARLRATLHYVAINLTASGVFLIAVSLLYGLTGTLNMAHLAERLAALSAEDVPLARAAGLLLVGVFCVKAALFPLYFWLPQGYSEAAPPVAALFAVMTKVGVYSIVRVTSLVFGRDGGDAADLLSPWLLPLALGTLAIGTIGALGAQRLATMTAYLTVASVGTMLTAFAAGGAEGLAAALYYAAHSTIVIAILFLVGDLLGRERGAVGDALHMGPALTRAALLGLLFLMAGATVAGLPPSSGFIGKLMVLQSVRGTGEAAAIWAVVLVTSLLMVIASVRAGSIVLWSVGRRAAGQPAGGARAGEWAALILLVGCSLALIVGAGPAHTFTTRAAEQLHARELYVDAVLAGGRAELLRGLPERVDR
jgi:multicomponent K+:H+ antiporter subunit D